MDVVGRVIAKVSFVAAATSSTSSIAEYEVFISFVRVCNGTICSCLNLLMGDGCGLKNRLFLRRENTVCEWRGPFFFMNIPLVYVKKM